MSDTEKQTPETQADETPAKKPLFSFANCSFLKRSSEKSEGDDDSEDSGDGKKKKKKKTWKQELLEWVVTIGVALVIAFVVRSFIFEPVVVDGDSMYPTLKHGEIMYVSKTSYGSGFFGIPFTDIGFYFNVGGNPDRGDVVVCHYNDENKNVVKRVVGLPGDTLELRGGLLYVTDANGLSVGGYDRAGNPLPVDEDFIYSPGTFDYGPIYIPCKGDPIAPGSQETYAEDHYFLLGDNRTNSRDSRATGPVCRSEIVGKVEAVIWHDIPSRLDDQAGHKPIGR